MGKDTVRCTGIGESCAALVVSLILITRPSSPEHRIVHYKYPSPRYLCGITTQWLHQRKASKSVAPFAQQRDFPFASPPVVAVAETLSCPSQAKPPSSSFACAFSHVRIWWPRTVVASATRAFHLTPRYPH